MQPSEEGHNLKRINFSIDENGHPVLVRPVSKTSGYVLHYWIDPNPECSNENGWSISLFDDEEVGHECVQSYGFKCLEDALLKFGSMGAFESENHSEGRRRL